MYSADKTETIRKFVEVFEQYGIEAASISKLCDYGKINRNTVYQMFYNKEDIVLSCGNYVVSLLESEIHAKRKGIAMSSEELGLMFFDVFKKHIKKVRFCMQLMCSPDPAFANVKQSSEQAITDWSNTIADSLHYGREWFEVKFRLFLSVMYYYCMTENEPAALEQCRFIFAIEPKE